MEPEVIEREAQSAIAAAATTDELDDARVRYLGRKSELKQALRGVRDRESGMALNALRERLEEAVAARRAELESAELERLLTPGGIDVTFPGEPFPRGRLHLLTQVRREIEDIFLGLGYEVWDGDEVTPVWYSFDALTTDPGHPSRLPSEPFYVDDDTVLRPHTSSDQIRAMESRPPPLYLISPGRCYRRDTPDATHSPTFLQFECLAVDRGITLADLQGTVLHFFRALCKHSGWIEMGGAGVVDPGVYELVGYDPEEWSGFAFGLGIERIAMLRHGLPDLRAFWENDLRVLAQF